MGSNQIFQRKLFFSGDCLEKIPGNDKSFDKFIEAFI